jgi:hypothetical protein
VRIFKLVSLHDPNVEIELDATNTHDAYLEALTELDYGITVEELCPCCHQSKKQINEKESD